MFKLFSYCDKDVLFQCSSFSLTVTRTCSVCSLTKRNIYSSRYHMAEDVAYGSQSSDGPWNGVTKLVASNKVEVGIGWIIFSEERISAVNFLPPIVTSR